MSFYVGYDTDADETTLFPFLLNLPPLPTPPAPPFLSQSAPSSLTSTPVPNEDPSSSSAASTSSPLKENDYLEEFRKIVSADQHTEYLRVFEKEYKEYMHLTDKITATALAAKQLDKELESEREIFVFVLVALLS